MITGLHVLLTYACDHCFLSCGPERTGVFTLERLSRLIRQEKNKNYLIHKF